MAPKRQSPQRSMISISGSSGLMLGQTPNESRISLRAETVFDVQAERQLCLNSSVEGEKRRVRISRSERRCVPDDQIK